MICCIPKALVSGAVYLIDAEYLRETAEKELLKKCDFLISVANNVPIIRLCTQISLFKTHSNPIKQALLSGAIANF